MRLAWKYFAILHFNSADLHHAITIQR